MRRHGMSRVRAAEGVQGIKCRDGARGRDLVEPVLRVPRSGREGGGGEF